MFYYKEQEKIRLLFVCLGNICRSPAAEGIMKKLVTDMSLDKQIEIGSAGITGYHEGELPDSRMRKYAKERGYVLDSRSRPVRMDDYYDFDMIIGMDDFNINALKKKAPDAESSKKIHRMTDFSMNLSYDHVPDPYYEGVSGFNLVLDILEDACSGLLNKFVIFSIPDN